MFYNISNYVYNLETGPILYRHYVYDISARSVTALLILITHNVIVGLITQDISKYDIISFLALLINKIEMTFYELTS